MSASSDISAMRRLLGVAANADERTLLAIAPDLVLKSGLIEAALERRIDEIARHPLAQSAEARRLVAQLEAAADRLQAKLLLDGKGPLHPTAAKRAAKRVMEHAPRESTKGPVVAPQAVRARGTGLTADDLTDFDRLALALLVVSGGWNAASAKRLSVVAADHGVSVDDLYRIVEGLTKFLSEGEGLRGAMGEVGSTARTMIAPVVKQSGTDIAEGAVERVFGRINDVIRHEVTSGSAHSQARLAIIFGAVALGWIAALGYLFFTPATPSNTPTLYVAPTNASSAAKGDPAVTALDASSTSVDANGVATAPIAVHAAAVKYPRAPGFVPAAMPVDMVESASGGAAWIADIEDATRVVRSGKGVFDDATLREVTEQLTRAADAWPAAGTYRSELVRAMSALAHETRGADSTRRLMQAIPGTTADVNRAGLARWQRIWRSAFGAGVLTTIALDRSQPNEVAAAAREELRTRTLPIPRGEVTDAFATGATTVLGIAAKTLADDMAIGVISDLVDASRWAQAVDAASTSAALRTQVAVAAIDAALRSPGALDQPGPLVDFLAYAIHMLDFTGRGAGAQQVRTNLDTWITDPAIAPSRIWAFSSLLDADLAIAWYGPDLVMATNADVQARRELAARVAAAFPKMGTTSIGEAILVETYDLDEWKKKVATARVLADTDLADRLRTSAVALAAARVARGFEQDAPKATKTAMDDLDALLARTEKDWNASPIGDRAGLPAAGVGDGEFATQWQESRRDQGARIDLIRSLSARPGSGDLGPIDARLVATEALRSNQPEVRDAMCSMIVDRYSRGREVLRALLDALADGPASQSGKEFVSSLVGVGVGGNDWQAEARGLIIERIIMLEDNRLHAVDAASAEIVSGANALTTSYGRGGNAASASGRPERALSALADALRADAASKFLAAPFPSTAEEIERLRSARRSLAASATQRMAAETPAIVDYAAMLAAARQPALVSKLTEVLANARRVRTSAATAGEQVENDLLTYLAVIELSLAPKATKREID